MIATLPHTLIDEIVERIQALGLGDSAVAWTYRSTERQRIRPGASAMTDPSVSRAPELLARCIDAMGPAYRRHMAREALERPRIASWSSIRERTGEIGTLFEDEILNPCRVSDYLRAYVVVGDQVLGFLSTSRSVGPPFGSREIQRFQRALNPLSRQMASVLRAEHRLQEEALLFAPEGQLLHATPAAWALLDRLGSPDDVGRALVGPLRSRSCTVELGEVSFALRRLVGPAGSAVLARPISPARVRVNPLDLLTDRQREVATRVARGGPLTQAAEDLGVRPSTVRAHLKAIYATLAIGTRAELVQAVERYVRALHPPFHVRGVSTPS